MTKLKYRWVFWFLKGRVQAGYSEWQYPVQGLISWPVWILGWVLSTTSGSHPLFREGKMVFMVHALFLMPPPLELSCPLGLWYYWIFNFFLSTCVPSLSHCFWVCHNFEGFWRQSHKQHLELSVACKVKAGVWLKANPPWAVENAIHC